MLSALKLLFKSFIVFKVSSTPILTNIENDSLALYCVFHGEVEPDPEFWIARVRSDKEVILEVRNVIHSSDIATLETGVENEMTSFGFARIPGRNCTKLIHVAYYRFFRVILAPSSSTSVFGATSGGVFVGRGPKRRKNEQNIYHCKDHFSIDVFCLNSESACMQKRSCEIMLKFSY